ncbi:MAG: hypothetical protein Q9224_005312 [Gallowayella concinna]
MAGITPNKMSSVKLHKDLAVPHTAHLRRSDLSDADAPGETDISDDGTTPEHSGHHYSFGPTESEPVTEGAQERKSVPKPQHRPSHSDHRRRSTITHRGLPNSTRGTGKEHQIHGRRGRETQTRPVGRPRKASPSPVSERGPRSVKGRAPTAEERNTARAKAERLTQELDSSWHNRAAKMAKKAEVTRLTKVAAGGYIDPSMEQESPQEEVRKRKRPGVKAPAPEQSELEIDESGWLPGERERWWAEITKGRTEQEHEIDLAGNIISTNAAEDDTQIQGEDEGGYEYEGFDGDLGRIPTFFDEVEDAAKEPMPPPKKRHSAPRGSSRKH